MKFFIFCCCCYLSRLIFSFNLICYFFFLNFETKKIGIYPPIATQFLTFSLDNSKNKNCPREIIKKLRKKKKKSQLFSLNIIMLHETIHSIAFQLCSFFFLIAGDFISLFLQRFIDVFFSFCRSDQTKNAKLFFLSNRHHLTILFFSCKRNENMFK